MTIRNKKFGWANIEIPVLGQGTWMIEGDQLQERKAIEALRLGLDLGLSHIDTAEMYGNGRAEELVGEAISTRRSEVFLVSKVLPQNASYKGTLKACERSLKRLKTEWLDLYLLHWQGQYPIKETMRAMETLVDQGKIRFIGVSNFDLDQIKEAEQALNHHRLLCNQVLYHLGDRGIERHLIPYCSAQEISVVAYSPFGHSDFPSLHSKGGKLLSEIASSRGRTIRQIILNFLTRNPAVFTIPKASKTQHVHENSGSTDWDLLKEDIEIIDQAFPAPDYDVPLGML
ncbi:MAG: aldo/keto reductase [Acidobacteriia bacterium]|nr:aldo/keto reductase [Terriglobia bacterium]